MKRYEKWIDFKDKIETAYPNVKYHINAEHDIESGYQVLVDAIKNPKK